MDGRQGRRRRSAAALREATRTKPDASRGDSNATGSAAGSTTIELGCVGLAQRPHRFLALIARSAVEDQHAVEVVDLVLYDPRLEP